MPTIGAAVTEATKNAFESAARVRCTTTSRLNASLIHDFLAREAGTASPNSLGLPPRPLARHAADLLPTRTKQVFVRLEPYYYAELKRLASERDWYRGTYLANLFYAHADQRPVLCLQEINALRLVARQLSDIARNLHAVAMHLRISPAQACLLTSFEFQLLEMLIAAEIIAVKGLISANLRGWGVSDADT